MARRYEDEEGLGHGNGGTGTGDDDDRDKPKLPYDGKHITPIDKDITPINIPESLNNPVWFMKEFLIRPSSEIDSGLHSHQYVMVKNVVLPGTKYTVNELGDKVAFDNDSFAAANITLFGDAFTDKLFLITNIKLTENGITLSETIEVNQNFIKKPPPPNPFD